MATDVNVRDGLFDFRHVTADALISQTAGPVMRVFFDRSGTRTVRGLRAVAFQADDIRGLKQVRIIVGPMNVVATEAAYAMSVHHALHEVVSLHAVLVRGSVREVGERLFSQLVLFQLPVVPQVPTRLKADRPIVVLPVYRVL